MKPTRAASAAEAAKPAASPLYRNGAALALSGVISGLLGAGFWIVAAHSTPRAAIGEATAMVSAMMALSMLGQLNLGPALAAFLPRAGYHRTQLVVGGGAAAVGISLVLGAGFVLVAPRVSASFDTLARPLPAVVFTLSVAVWSVFALQDAVLTGMRRATWVPLKSAVYNISKFGVLAAIGGSVFALLGAWILPAALAVVPLSFVLLRKVLPTTQAPAADTDVRSFRRFLAGESTAMVFDQIGVTLLPVLVLVMLGPEKSAPFGLVWMITQALDVLVVGMGSSLIVEGAQPGADVHGMHRAMRARTMAALGAAIAIGIAGAPLFLRIFGGQYAGDSVGIFRLLLLGSLLRVVVTLAICTARAERRIAWIVRLHMALAVLVPGGAVLLGHRFGLTGIGLSWVGSQFVMATVVVLDERRRDRRRRRDDGRDQTPRANVQPTPAPGPTPMPRPRRATAVLPVRGVPAPAAAADHHHRIHTGKEADE